MEPLILQLSSSEFKDNGAKEETMKEQGLLATHIESLYVKLWLPCLIKSNLVLIAIFFCLLKLNSHSKSGRLRGEASIPEYCMCIVCLFPNQAAGVLPELLSMSVLYVSIGFTSDTNDILRW